MALQAELVGRGMHGFGAGAQAWSGFQTRETRHQNFQLLKWRAAQRVLRTRHAGMNRPGHARSGIRSSAWRHPTAYSEGSIHWIGWISLSGSIRAATSRPQGWPTSISMARHRNEPQGGAPARRLAAGCRPSLVASGRRWLQWGLRGRGRGGGWYYRAPLPAARRL